MREPPALLDAHCHLDWFPDAAGVARDAAEMGLGILAVTVTPAGHERAARLLQDAPNVTVGAGLHPWWVADGSCDASDVGRAAELARCCRLVGEVGIDLSEHHVPRDSRARQVKSLSRILRACGEAASASGPRLVSLHAVRAAGVVLDLLEETGCARSCRCVLHWFSGTGDELVRARRLGCLFSVNEMMLRTRRGREYARQLPGDRLLLETDLPPGEGAACTAADVAASLDRTLDALRELRPDDPSDAIADNGRRLLEETGIRLAT